MWSMKRFLFQVVVGISACLVIVQATPPSSSHHSHQPPTIIIKPQPPSHTGGVSTSPLAPSNTCPVPSEEMLRCIRQWACQYIIRLDLRCLLNLNGNPLLGNVLGGAATSPIAGGAGGGGVGGNGGLLGGILGL